VAATQGASLLIVPTTCFNCESACGLLAYIDKVTGEVQKFEGNPNIPARVAATAPKVRQHSTR
jgi:anaerobic selenocysteine-containing dehydrogenase